jgi:hypothetical protein
MVFQDDQIELAKASEDANYMNKNRYRLQRKVIDYADKKRMPIDESKVKDILKNKGVIKNQMVNEIATYDEFLKNPQFEHGLLSYLNEASYGEMRDMIRELGIKADNLEFVNVGDLQKRREASLTTQSDHNF